jgi:hypothetical protein
VEIGVDFCTQILSTPDTPAPNHQATKFGNSDEPSEQEATELQVPKLVIEMALLQRKQWALALSEPPEYDE